MLHLQRVTKTYGRGGGAIALRLPNLDKLCGGDALHPLVIKFSSDHLNPINTKYPLNCALHPVIPRIAVCRLPAAGSPVAHISFVTPNPIIRARRQDQLLHLSP